MCIRDRNLPQLIIFRLFQGLFGGGLQPNQQSIILDTFPPARRGAAFGITAIATIVAPILGPTLGGIITDDLTWRWAVSYTHLDVYKRQGSARNGSRHNPVSAVRAAESALRWSTTPWP